MLPLAVSTAIQIAYVVALVTVLFGPYTVAELKDQGLLASTGWLTAGITSWIAAFRLARPESWWARHLYGRRKRERALERYGEPEDE